MTLRFSAGLWLSALILSGSAQAQQEPAGEGRPITPAGMLVMDVSTHLPAVGAMPMTMLRSPDQLGPGGGGRYLLVANSGYGVRFRFDPKAAAPVQPASPGPNTKVRAPFLLISNPQEVSTKDYNGGKAALYPTGLAVTRDGSTLVVANNLGDNVTIVHELSGARKM